MSGNMPKTFSGPAVFGSVRLYKDNTELLGYVLTDGTLQFQFYSDPPQNYSNLLEVHVAWIARQNEHMRKMNEGAFKLGSTEA